MTKRNSSVFNKFKPILAALTILSVLTWSFGPAVPKIQAIGTTAATDSTGGSLRLKQGSDFQLALKVQLGSDSNGENLNAIAIAFTGTSGTPTWTQSAAVSSELLDLATTGGGISLWKESGDATGFQASGVATDTPVTLAAAPVYGASNTFTLTPAVPPLIATDDIYYVVLKSDTSGVTNSNAFTMTIPTNGVVTSDTSPTITQVTTAPITMDTVAPTIDNSRTGPGNPSTPATNVPISAFVNVGFSENIDSTTINNTNITLTTGGSPVGVGFKTMPDGFAVTVSDPPTYATSTSRFAKVANTAFGFFMIPGSGSITPMGSYTTPAAGDIVYFQHETFPAELGIITAATLTAGTFGVNNFILYGGQQLVKFASAATTTAVSDATVLNKGDIVVANTTANPTGDRYAWHIVTSANAIAVNHANFRLDGSDSAPTFVSGSNLSAIAPAATATDNGATGGGTLAVNVGDLVFAKLAGGSYSWHIATGAGNLSSTSTEATAILDSLATVAASQVAEGSIMSKIVPSVQGAVTDTTTVLSMGDVIFTKTTANAANNGAYNFHMVSSGATGIASTNLRLDNVSASLAISTAYTLTIGTGVKDRAGNSLASQQTISFTTGSTGTTNMTPPFVQSTQPQGGVQNFPPNAPVKVTFSVGMAADGAGSVLNTSNVGLYTDSYGAPGNLISTTNSYDPVTRTVSLTPTNLGLSTGYMVKVANTTKSSTGAAMFNEYRLFFRTNSSVDNSAPTVLGVSPANNATTTRSTIVSIGFSKDITPASINTTNVTLEKTSDHTSVAGSVGYTPSSRTAQFAPSSQLEGNTNYTLKLLAGVIDLAGNPLTLYTSVFNTNNDTDSTGAAVVSVNADNYGVSVTFSEPVKSGNSPSSADNVANYTLESPVGSSISLSGKSVAYDAGTKTTKITGLSLQNGNTFKVTVSNLVQDLANNGMQTSGTPALNTGFGTVQDSSITGGQLGPGSGPPPDPGMQGMNPIRISPMTRAAGVTSTYKIEFPVTTSIPATGQIVLTFPSGFDVTSAAAAAAGTASFCNQDLNGPQTGIVTIGSVTKDAVSGSVTINTAGEATGANAFLCMDLTGIVNSTIPSTAGYNVDIKTRDTAVNNRAVLESKTSAPFFLGQTGSRTLTVNVFNDNGAGVGTADNNTKDGAEAGIADVTVFLFSPASGGQNTTTNASGVASFSNLADGDYQIGLDPSTLAGGGFMFNSVPQPLTIAGNVTKNFGLRQSALTISGNITGPASTALDVFANSPNGFTSTSVTTDGAGAASYTLPARANTTYNVGVGPAIPKSFQQPGSPPPPPPTFNFMPPPPTEVVVVAASVTKNFTLTATDKTITGTVKDSTGTGVSNAGVFCRPTASSTTGAASGFGTGGQTDTTGAFSLRVINGVYLCGTFKPGMPPVPDKQIVVAAAGNTPTALNFVLDVGTSLTISGTVKDDSGNAIPYAGISGRKVVSTTDTNVMGGDPSNFVGGPTDSNGGYTLYVTQGTWVVEAFAPGFGRLGTKTISVGSSNSTGQDFSAQNMTFRTITGTATRSSAATQGVMIRAENSTGSSGNMTYAAADGTYTIKVPDGTYTVTCFFPGLGDIAAIGGSVTLSAGTATAVRDCTAGAPITITVNVTDGTNPITDAGVDVRDSSGRGNFTNNSVASSTDVSLAVYSVSVPPGTYTVRVGHPAFGKIGETADVDSTRVITHTAAAGQVYAVTGTIKSGGSALANAWVSLIGTATGQTNSVFLGSQSIANGTFSISVPSGTYRLRVDKPGYRSPAESTVNVNGAAKAVGDITLTTASRTITGTVTLSGSAVSNAFVDAADGAGGYAVSQTDVNGAYSLAVDNGTWTLRAHAPGYEGGPLPVTVNDNSPSSQTITLTAMSGFTVKPERPETVTPTSGGFLTNTDIGVRFKMDIPANALGTGSNSATVTTKVNTAMPNPPSGSILSKNAVTISAVGSDGSKISSLNDSITIVVPYDEANLPSGALEANLVLGSWNDATQSYDTLPTTVDITNNTLTATVSHLSDFAPLVPSGVGAPSTPTNLAAVDLASSGSIRLTWTAVSGATSYNIYKSTDNSTFPLLASTSGTTYNANGLTNFDVCYFKVSAVNSTGNESAATAAVSVIPTGGGSGGGSGGGGYTPPVTTPASTTTPATTTPVSTTPTIPVVPGTLAPAGAHPNGTLVLDGSTIYLVKDGQRYGFRDAKEYQSHGYNFGQAVAANAQDKAMPQAEFVQKALQGTLVLDASDNRTVYMIGTGNTKRGFATADVFKALGYSFANLPKINLSDYPAGPAITIATDTHPEGALVLEGKTVWWILGGVRQGFESMAVFNTYGFATSKIVKANAADLGLTQGSLVKFRDGTLVSEGGLYYLISDGKKLSFASASDLTSRGYKTSNAISAGLTNYESGGSVQ